MRQQDYAAVMSAAYAEDPERTYPSLLEQVEMEVAALLELPSWWGDDPFAGIPNAHDEDNEPF